MKKTQCPMCLNFFANKAGNYNRHIIVCSGSYKKREDIGKCEHCVQKFDLSDKTNGWMANHVRWCVKNPKRSQYKNYGAKQLNTIEARKKAIEKIKDAHRRGAYTASNLLKKGKSGVKHTDKSKKNNESKSFG